MDQIAEILGQALLDHHREFCLPLALTADKVSPSVRDSVTISYSGLCAKSNPPVPVAHGIGKYLVQVAQWCKDRRLPPIHSLAVNAETRTPGFNYPGAPDTWGNWDEEIAECIACKTYPLSIVTSS